LHEKDISEEKLKEIINENKRLKKEQEKYIEELKNAQEQKKVIIYCENQNAIILNSL
jgi:peroxiredoxin family protein